MLLLIIACKNINHVRQPEFSSDKVYSKVISIEHLNGYLYEFFQVKCPGATSTHMGKNWCVRNSVVFSPEKVENPSDIFINDSLKMDSKLLFVLDFLKIEKVASNDDFEIEEADSTNFIKAINEGVYYVGSLLTSKENPQSKNIDECKKIRNERKFKITECKIESEVGIRYKVHKKLVTYVTSPTIKVANLGMPVKFMGDYLDAIWVVPGDSFLLNHLREISQ